MTMRLNLGWHIAAAAILIVLAIARPAAAASPEDTLVLKLKSGTVRIELWPDIAPKHVERVKKLVREGFYDGLKFHRVIAGFMAQTGDPRGDGTGGSKYGPLPAEFSDTPFTRGTIGAARTRDPNSANSQWFICFNDGCSHLTGQYTVWGQVVEGMEHVDQIKQGSAAQNGLVAKPDTIISLKVEADGP